ncbi:hypothetical protein LXL04_028940 [Taraxacum kok-saghyz]
MPTLSPATCSLKHENLCATAYCCRCALLFLSESRRLSFGILFPPSRLLLRLTSRSPFRSAGPSLPTTIKSQKTMSFLDLSLEDLPLEVMVDILSRLPVKTIIQCKCVCKKWRDIILDSYFADIQHSRSPAGVMIHTNNKENYHYPKTGILRWTEVEDELGHHHLHHDPVMSIDLDRSPIFHRSRVVPVGSVSGLLCLRQHGRKNDNLYICNPVTREYMILSGQKYYTEGVATNAYCFGFCSLTREYKVIRLLEEKPTSESRPILVEAQVYVLGTGQWRSIGHVPYRLTGSDAPFLNGQGHWIVLDNDSPEKIWAFDFDKETFDLFPSPPYEDVRQTQMYKTLGVLKGCLCQCESYDSNWTVWVMKEYGIKKSWHKEFVFAKESITPGLDMDTSEPMKVIDGLKDGTIVMASYRDALFVYCPWRKTIVDAEVYQYFFRACAYRPSFHRLHNFENEIVDVFVRSK